MVVLMMLALLVNLKKYRPMIGFIVEITGILL